MEVFRSSSGLESALELIDWFISSPPCRLQSRQASERQLDWLANAKNRVDKRLLSRIEQLETFILSKCSGELSEAGHHSIMEGVENVRLAFDSEMQPSSSPTQHFNVLCGEQSPILGSQMLDAEVSFDLSCPQESLRLFEKALDQLLSLDAKTVVKIAVLSPKLEQLTRKLSAESDSTRQATPSFETFRDLTSLGNLPSCQNICQISGKGRQRVASEAPVVEQRGFFADLASQFLNKQLEKENLIKSSAPKRLSKNFASLGRQEVKSDHQVFAAIVQGIGDVHMSPFRASLELLSLIIFLISRSHSSELTKAMPAFVELAKEAQRNILRQQRFKVPSEFLFTDLGHSLEQINDQAFLIDNWVLKCEELHFQVRNSFVHNLRQKR